MIQSLWICDSSTIKKIKIKIQDEKVKWIISKYWNALFWLYGSCWEKRKNSGFNYQFSLTSQSFSDPFKWHGWSLLYSLKKCISVYWNYTSAPPPLPVSSPSDSSDMYNSVVSIPDYNTLVKIVFYELSILLAKSDFTKAFCNCFIVDF